MHAKTPARTSLRTPRNSLLAALLSTLACAGPASAEEIPGTEPSRMVPIEVPLVQVPRVVFTSRGRILLDETGVQLRPVTPGVIQPGTGLGPTLRGPGCVQMASNTIASFTGGSYTVQAGFSQTEQAAASYTLPVSAFPIKIESLEMIFATSNSSQQTTTGWGVKVWNGLPTTGTIVAEYHSSTDPADVPPFILAPGTNGIDVTFLIDPQDPEQIYVGPPIGYVGSSFTFSIAYSLDHHNAQTQNPCTTAPPTCCNAFPVTDNTSNTNYSQLNFPMDNWLFGVNCGSFGCPSNGGWARFSSLNTLCRPHGDWVMRANYSSVNCQPGVGACCLPSGACNQMLIADCQSAGGAYRGDASQCGSLNPPCMALPGACCFQSTGGCLNLTQADCTSANGVFQGAGTACSTTVCFPRGACCLPSGACTGPISPTQCQSQGGTYRGNNTTCAQQSCPLPTGACCFGAGGSCLSLTQANCATAGGSWRGAGTGCAGACTPACPADWNIDGEVNGNDISDYINSWYGDIINGTIGADFNTDGETNGNDISDYINAWYGAISCGGYCC